MQFSKHWSIVGKVLVFYVGDLIKSLKLIFTCEGLYFGQFRIIAQVIIEIYSRALIGRELRYISL